MTQENTVSYFWNSRLETATLTASSEASAALSVENIIGYQPQEKWRTNGCAEEYFNAAFASTYAVDTIVLWAHNYSPAGLIRVEIWGPDDPVTPVYDSGFTISPWPSLYGYDEDGYDEHGFDGVPLPEEIAGYQKQTIILLGTVYNAVRVRVTVQDPDNTDGFLELGWAGAGLRFSMDYDFSIGNNLLATWVDPSDIIETEGGATFIVGKPKYRIAQVNHDFMSTDECFNKVTDMIRTCGRSRPIVLILFPDDEALLYRTTIYGLITNAGQGVPLALVRKDSGGHSYSTTIEVKEII